MYSYHVTQADKNRVNDCGLISIAMSYVTFDDQDFFLFDMYVCFHSPSQSKHDVHISHRATSDFNSPSYIILSKVYQTRLKRLSFS